MMATVMPDFMIVLAEIKYQTVTFSLVKKMFCFVWNLASDLNDKKSRFPQNQTRRSSQNQPTNHSKKKVKIQKRK